MRETKRSGASGHRAAGGGREFRLLVVTATFPPTRCGVGDYSRRLAAELTRAGSVYVLTGESEDPEHQHVHPESLPPVDRRPPASVVPPPEFREEYAGVHVARCVAQWDWRTLDVLRSALSRIEPTLISLQYHGEDYLLHPAICHVPALAREMGIPTVTTLHNLQKPRALDGDADPLRTLLVDSSAWITTNALDAVELEPLDGSAEKLHQVFSGACLPAPSAQSREPAADPFRLAYFGFLNPVKGVEHLLRATALLRDAGRDVRLTLAAGLHTDASDRLFRYAEEVDEEIERLRLDSHLDRFGYLDDAAVSRLLLTCRLAVFPFRDGLSGKNASFWSALDHGTPTLTTRGPGLPHGLIHREQVLLAEPRDPDALAREIGWAMDHPDELEALGRSGRGFVRRHLDWSMIGQSTLEIFSASLARQGKVAGA